MPMIPAVTNAVTVQKIYSGLYLRIYMVTPPGHLRVNVALQVRCTFDFSAVSGISQVLPTEKEAGNFQICEFEEVMASRNHCSRA